MPEQKPTKNNTKELITEFFTALPFLFLGDLFLFSVKNPTAMLAAIKIANINQIAFVRYKNNARLNKPS
jgi:hypothetical protein